MNRKRASLRLVWLLFATVTLLGIGSHIWAQDGQSAGEGQAETQSENESQPEPANSETGDQAEGAAEGSTPEPADDPDAPVDPDPRANQPAWINAIDDFFGNFPY